MSRLVCIVGKGLRKGVNKTRRVYSVVLPSICMRNSNYALPAVSGFCVTSFMWGNKTLRVNDFVTKILIGT